MSKQDAQGDEPQRGAFSRIDGALRFRYLGLGFIWAWIFSAFETFALFPDRPGGGIDADASWLISAITVVVTLFLSGALLGRRRVGNLEALGMASAVAAFAGTLLAAIATHAALPVWVSSISGILTGFGTGLLFVLWGHALSELGEEQVEVAVPASCVIMFACGLVFPSLSGIIGVVATALLPFVSGLMLVATLRDEEHAEPREVLQRISISSPQGRDLIRIVARVAAILCLAYFVIGCCDVLRLGHCDVQRMLGIAVPTTLGAIVGIGLVVCFLLYSVRVSFDVLYRWVAPLLVVSTALFPISDSRVVFVAETLVSVSDMALEIGGVLFVVTLAKRFQVSGALGMGLMQGALQLGVLGGNVCAIFLRETGFAADAGQAAIALLLLAILGISWLFYPTDRRAYKVTRLATSIHDVRRVEEDADKDEPLLLACELIAKEGALSARESEVLVYLAHGRSQPYIRDALTLSKNTVATHVKHIYQKLDVHSRQELLDLIEERR